MDEVSPSKSFHFVRHTLFAKSASLSLSHRNRWAPLGNLQLVCRSDSQQACKTQYCIELCQQMEDFLKIFMAAASFHAALRSILDTDYCTLL